MHKATSSSLLRIWFLFSKFYFRKISLYSFTIKIIDSSIFLKSFSLFFFFLNLNKDICFNYITQPWTWSRWEQQIIGHFRCVKCWVIVDQAFTCFRIIPNIHAVCASIYDWRVKPKNQAFSRKKILARINSIASATTV